MISDGVELDRDGSWECQHVRRSGEPAPATRLRIDGMPPPNPGRPTSARKRIICPDCGKNIAFRGRCPKCAGNSWIPAGHSGGVFERMKAQRLRRMIADDENDDTLTRREVAEPTPS